MTKLSEFRDTFNLVEYCKGLDQNYQRTGANILIRCPYHQDEHPSLLVDQKRAYCFSCLANVEAIDLVCRIEGKTINEVLENGISNQYIRPPEAQKEKKHTYAPPNERYIEHGKRMLAKNKHAMEYLIKRGLTNESIKKWGLGYIKPPTTTFLFPRFAFPCYDEKNNLISVVYRADPRYEPDSKSKYVIHPNTPATLFGIEKVGSCRSFLYSGGQIDAILLNQYGIPSIGVSGEGTFKIEWARRLRSLDNLYLILDNDDAGRKATKKILDIMKNAVALEWPINTEGYDVADLINDKDYGIEGIWWMLKNVGANKDTFRKLDA